MAGNPFKKALLSESRLRLALTGPAGSGKTFTALRIAKGLLNAILESGINVGNGRIALIDTEHGSAAKYAGLFDFDSAELANFHPDMYISLMKAAERAGYPIIVVDSLSHAWAGTGGLLQVHNEETERSKSKNSWTAWSRVTPIHNQLIDAILQSGCHVIGTMRCKTEWMTGRDSDGKFTVEKVGLAPVQRQDMDYEFDLFGALNQDHTLVIDKSRFNQFDNKIVPKPDEEFGTSLHHCLTGSGEQVTSWTPPIPVRQLLSLEIIDKINNLCSGIGMPEKDYLIMLRKRNVTEIKELTEEQAQEIIANLQKIKDRQKAQAKVATSPAPVESKDASDKPDETESKPLPENWSKLIQSWPEAAKDWFAKMTEQKMFMEMMDEISAGSAAFWLTLAKITAGDFASTNGESQAKPQSEIITEAAAEVAIEGGDASDIVNDNISKLKRKPKPAKKGG